MSGEIRLPAADARVSLVSVTDVGRCLAALALDPAAGGTYELTGPAALDLHDVADRATRAWRVPIRYVDLTPEDHQREMAAGDLDPWWCYAFSSMFASVREHRWEQATDQVLRLTGREPLGLGDLLVG